MDINNMTRNFFEDEIQYESLEGKLLVASPHLEDPYFSRTIIYLCAHDESGAVGIIVNQKIGTISSKDLVFTGQKPEKPLKHKRLPLMFGGPTNSDMLLILSKKKDDEKSLITQSFIVHTDIFGFLEDEQNKKNNLDKNKFILAKGVAAWESQQLEEEVESNDWLVVEPTLDLVFSNKRGDTTWNKIIKSIGIVKPHELVHYSGSA